jgi:aminopeptidase N
MQTMSEARRIRREDYRPSAWRCERVELRFELGEQECLVHATLQLAPDPAQPPQPLWLDGESLDLRALALDGRALSAGDYERRAEGLLFTGLARACELQTTVALRPQDNTALCGLYRSGGLFCTQCEAMGFRRITYFLDRPDVLARFTVTIEAERGRYPRLLANGNLIAEEELPGGRHRAVWQDPHPKPCYLFALVAGDLHCHAGDYFTAEGRSVRCEILVEAENRDKCAHALASLQAAMRWDEEVFGLSYDLDRYMIVAVNDFNMGAMENKGLNVFNAKYVLASPETATDLDYERIEGVIGHEYFHNWTGNRITCRDWFQLTLKEGLTVYRDQRFTADRCDATVKRIDDVVALQSRQWPEDRGPMAHPIRPASYLSMDNFYTLTVYEKGAEVVRLYEMLLGRAGFRRGMDCYVARHDGQAVTCEDFRAAMAEANGVDLSALVRWYDQAGTPELLVTEGWEPGPGRYRLRFEQVWPELPQCRDNQAVPIPIRLGLLDGQGRELDLAGVPGLRQVDGCWQLDMIDARCALQIEGLRSKPVASVLRQFSAPVKLRFAQPEAELALRLAHDADPFNRWQAGQELARRLLLAHIAAGELPAAATAAYTTAWTALLADSALDGSFVACALELPSEDLLAQDCMVVDPDRIHAAREALRLACARAGRAALLACHQRLADPAPYCFEHAAVARRRLRNASLRHLIVLAEEEVIALAWQQYQEAGNMSDRQAALEALCEIEDPRRDQALADFLARFGHDPQVVDKWFACQARSPRCGRPDDITRLQRHAHFHAANPNRFRSLVAVFAQGNPVGFHRPDGAGYQLVAEAVLDQDARNPQVAARLVAAFNQWRSFDEGRQALMRGELARIKARPGLSKDVFEIVERALT